MFDTKTPFRHFHCHGVIHRRKRLDKFIFKCAKCWEWSYDLFDLVADPRLKTSAPAKEMRQETAVTTTD